MDLTHGVCRRTSEGTVNEKTIRTRVSWLSVEVVQSPPWILPCLLQLLKPPPVFYLEETTDNYCGKVPKLLRFVVASERCCSSANGDADTV